MRVLEIPLAPGANPFELKRVGGGVLVQTPDVQRHPAGTARWSPSAPSEQEMSDLLFRLARGQVRQVQRHRVLQGWPDRRRRRRPDEPGGFTRIAAHQGRADAGLPLVGAVAADAFFPFRDGIDVIAEQGITAIIHPGGSMRDEEVFAAANEHGIAMVLTGVRHFRH